MFLLYFLSVHLNFEMMGVNSTLLLLSWSSSWFVTVSTLAGASQKLLTDPHMPHIQCYHIPLIDTCISMLLSPTTGLNQYQQPLDQAFTATASLQPMAEMNVAQQELHPSWIFRAHHGGSEGNGGTSALLQAPVIIYQALVSVGTRR